ncbi:GTPase IMAP family member 4-like [Poecilia formosa]|uniref:GTPase IMAP family member 4-like n=1 Tax=Poecilia formosa TaxID=48698 RepID=UPI000443AA2B|nr:PREDICTED: GTPase IMAP family member 4-like [Poecilia formosa]
MCSPGPHVFLLLVPILRSFTEKDLKALVEIMKPLTERVWRHCMVVFTYGDWLEGLPVENYIVKEGKKLQELLEKCGNRYHVLNRCHFYDPVQVKELLQKIFDMVKQNREYFTIKGKQTMFQKQPLSEKEHTFTEEEWIRREQELIERVMRALAKEPEEPTAPSMKVANSKNDFHIPEMSGVVASEDGSFSEFRNQQGHDYVAEWLTNKARQAEISSGIGSIYSLNMCMENSDESHPLDKNNEQSI